MSISCLDGNSATVRHEGKKNLSACLDGWIDTISSSSHYHFPHSFSTSPRRQRHRIMNHEGEGSPTLPTPKLGGQESATSHGAPTEAARKRGFSRLTSICFTVNYLIGTGFLTLPWAFQRGGILLSTITMVIVVVICNETKNYVLMAMARAEALVRAGRDGSAEGLDLSGDMEMMLPKAKGETSGDGYGSTVASHMEISAPHRRKSHDSGEEEDDEDEPLIVKDHKFEYTELCLMFLGKWGERAYVTCVGVAISLQLWGYAAVFGLGMAEYLPLGKQDRSFDDDYRTYILMFGSVVVPLSCLELREQVGFQILLSICRFLVIFLMIQTVRDAARHVDSGAVYFTDFDQSSSTGVTLVNLEGFYEMFSVLVFTAMFHNGIPVLSEPVGDRTKLSQNFRDAILVVCSACWVLGAATASYFGDSIEQSANLNWNSYVGGTGSPSDGTETWVDVALWPRIVSAFIVVFPPVNVVSAYPLNAVVLGNNLLVGAQGASAEPNRRDVILFRLLASSPPILGAYFVKELGIITSYSGVLAIITVLSFPALLFIRSKRLMEQRGKFNATYYDGLGSSEAAAFTVLGISIVASLYILVKLILF